MKKLLPVFMLFLCLSAFAQQENDKLFTIDVSGSAEVQVAPDEIIFSLDVTNVDMDLQKAKNMNDEIVGKVLTLTRRFSVLPQDVKTDYISLDKEFEYFREKDSKIYDEDGDEISKKTFKGYKISKTVIVKLKDISKFEEFFSEVLKTGITEVDSVKFETSKLRELRDKARELAMKAAFEKATAMAGAIGQKIGKAISVVETENVNRGYNINGVNSNSTTTFNFITQSSSFSGSESVATFAPGAIKVEASVKVSFLLN